MVQMNLFTKQKLKVTDVENKFMVTGKWRGAGGGWVGRRDKSGD